MSKIREFLGTQINKLCIRPYTFYPNSDIRYITEFKNGFATALIAKYGSYSRYVSHLEVALIDSSFKPAISTQYHCSDNSTWTNGHIIAINDNHPYGERCVFLDRELKEVSDKIFVSIQSHGDCFIVSKNITNPKYNRKTTFYGILDKDLKEILPFKYHKICILSATRFYCESEDSPTISFDCISRKTYNMEGIYSIYKESENGYYKFANNNKLLGYLNHEFQIVIEPKYTSLGEFDKKGFAPFSRDNVIGVVDTTGKEFIR